MSLAQAISEAEQRIFQGTAARVKREINEGLAAGTISYKQAANDAR